MVGVPSYNESFGLVALEAQACGRPVVATDVGGLRHAVNDQQTGLLVAGHDPAEWADALGSVLDHPDELVRMGANAAAHASTFSWDNTAAATLRAYAPAQRAYASTAEQSPRAVRRLREADASVRTRVGGGQRPGDVLQRLFSAFTPRKAATMPPMIISAAPMK